MTSLFFLALDGLDTDRVRARASELPTLSGLLTAGTCDVTEPRGLPGAFWPSLYAGARPGVHGVWHATSRWETAPFWQDWTARQRRCTVVDLPQMPVWPEAGLQVSAWGLDGVPATAFVTWPEDFAVRAHEHVGLPRRITDDVAVCDPNGARFVRDELVERITWKERLFELAQDTSDAEALCLGFDEARTAGLHLRDAPEALDAVYQRLDAAVARWLERPATAHVVLFRGRLVPGYDVVRFHEAVVQALAATSPVQGHRSLAWRLERWWRGSTLRHRRCRALPSVAPFGAVRIHVVGRDAGARIRRGGGYEALLDDLTEGLLAIRRTHDDGCPIAEVLRTDDEHPGRCRDDLPDLLVAWDPTVPITGLTSPRIGHLAWPGTRHAGLLQPGATLCARGIDLPERMAVEDVAAWLAGAFGSPDSSAPR